MAQKFQGIWQLCQENLPPRPLKNSPIWSHCPRRQCLRSSSAIADAAAVSPGFAINLANQLRRPQLLTAATSSTYLKLTCNVAALV